MQKLFNKILVPVDFSMRSKRAVEKAMLLAGEYQCSVTLLHVVSRYPWRSHLIKAGGGKVFIDNRRETEFRLWKFAKAASRFAGLPAPVINTVVQEGPWNDVMVRYIHAHQIDLVLAPQKKLLPSITGGTFNIDIIASVTNVPVITLPYEKKITRLQTIVIPVTDFLPVRKIMYGIYMAASSNATLQLLQVKNDSSGDTSEHYLYKAYRLIQDNCSVHADIEAASGVSVAAAIEEYMQRKTAGLVIVNPGVQTKLPGLFSRLLGRIMQQQAVAPVMTLSPL